ncbi:MAG: hypothetical protein AAF384_16305 [Pseudomonadota bacterium]
MTTNPSVLRARLGLFLLLSLALTKVSVASLVVDEQGHLVGARKLAVGGVPYNVAVADGTCATLFDGCDVAADFYSPMRQRQASLRWP